MWQKIWYSIFYRPIMKLAHKYNWHYAPPIYPDGDTQLWCKWCGFCQTIKVHTGDKRTDSETLVADAEMPIKEGRRKGKQ